MKAALKAMVLVAAELTGVTAIVRGSRWRSQRVLVLCYHGVSRADEHRWNPELYVTPEHLRRRFSALRELGATVLPLGEALQRCRDGTLPPRAVAITFDDGASNFASHAVPILREFGFPGTVYVTTYYVIHQFPVWNIAARYIEWATRRGPAPDPSVIGRLIGGDTARPNAGRIAMLDTFLRQWQSRGAADQDGAVHELARALGFDDRVMRESRMWHLMTPEQVAGLPRDLVSVQLHTHRHRQPQDWPGYAAEVEENRDVLQRLLGYRPVHFCYPSGEVHPQFPEYLARLGIESATTCVPGLLAPRGNLRLVPRLIDTMLTPDSTFRAWVAGTGALLTRA